MTSRKTRKLVQTGLVALAVVPMLALAACSSTGAATTPNAAPSDGVLTIGLLGDIGQPPDPDVYYANNGLAIVLNTYEGLVQYKNDTDTVEIAPRLADSWTVSPDFTTYTFTLKPNVTFHDGTPFTSAAVKSSLQRRVDVNGGAAYMAQGVASVDTPDDLTAVVTLKEPNSAFLDYLASPFGPKMVSPEGVAKNAGSDDAQTYLQTHDLGTGPYELSSVDPGTKYTLTQYDGYWGTKSPFSTVQLPIYSDVSALQLAFDKGDVSAIVAALPSSSLTKYDGNAAFNSDMLPTLQSALITVNPSKPFFAEKDARTAFMKSIDQQKLVSQVLGSRSEPATTLYAKGMISDGSDSRTSVTTRPRWRTTPRRCPPVHRWWWATPVTIRMPSRWPTWSRRICRRSESRPPRRGTPPRRCSAGRTTRLRAGRVHRRQQRARRRQPLHVGPRLLGQDGRHQLLLV